MKARKQITPHKSEISKAFFGLQSGGRILIQLPKTSKSYRLPRTGYAATHPNPEDLELVEENWSADIAREEDWIGIHLRPSTQGLPNYEISYDGPAFRRFSFSILMSAGEFPVVFEINNADEVVFGNYAPRPISHEGEYWDALDITSTLELLLSFMKDPKLRRVFIFPRSTLTRVTIGITGAIEQWRREITAITPEKLDASPAGFTRRGSRNYGA